jgi:hypothetical protein
MDHLFESDFYKHASLTHSNNPTNWSSTFSKHVNAATQWFFARLTSYRNTPTAPPDTDIMETDIDDTPILLPHAVDLLYLPASYGRIGICSPYISYILPIVWSLCLQHKGITITRTTTKNHLPPSHWSLFTNWQSSDSTTPMAKTSYEPAFLITPPPTTLTFLLQLTLTSMAFAGTFTAASTKPNLHKYPVTATPVTMPNHSLSLGIHSMYQQHKDHQLDCTTYWLALQCQLWLTVLPPLLIGTKCTCGKILVDPYGDHIFSCTQDKTQ